MKKVLALTAITLLFVGCKEPIPPVTDPVTDHETLRQTGVKTASTLVATLSAQLGAAVKEGDIAKGVEICSKTAQTLTESLVGDDPLVRAVGRTSSKTRNPKNMPDETDKVVLAMYENKEREGKPLPPYFVEALSEKVGGGYRYYQPLITNPMCVKCHGDKDTMDPQVVEALAKAYPEDMAMGYTTNVFRGLIKVDLSPQPLEMP